MGAAAALAAGAVAGTCRAGFVEFTDKDEWIAAIGEFTTITFTSFPDGTLITDQYAGQGIVFTDGDDRIDFFPGFANDNFGLVGNGDINMAFDGPRFWIGADFPGGVQFQLFREGALIFTSGSFGPSFAGVLSTEPFDMARIHAGASVAIDDLFFGVPAPGALGLFALAAARPGRRRRK